MMPSGEYSAAPLDLPETISGNDQTGGGLLAVVTVLGVIMVMVQGSMYFRAKQSAKFVGAEKNKILAQQMAEAGVEDNIADLGRRKLRVTEGMSDYITFENKALGGGFYTSKLSMVGLGKTVDTVDLASTGSVGSSSQSVHARLQLRKVLDSTLIRKISVASETTTTYSSHSVPETTSVTTVLDPETMPALNTTSGYGECMSSPGKKCDICHLPSGDVTKANVISVSKSSIDTHVDDHGDYFTTDGTCDLYKPKTVLTIRDRVVPDTVLAVVDHATYDTTLSVDTVIKVQFLSWK